MKPSANILFIVLTALIVAGGAYWYFNQYAKNEPPISAVSGSTQSLAQVEFQRLVTQLEPIQFNTAIFSDARFNALVDLTTAIAPETGRRQDPFAPIAGVSADSR